MLRHLVLVGQTAKKVHIKNIEQRSLTITGNKGLKSSINRNQSYAQKRVTGLNVFKIMFSPPILKDSIILFKETMVFK